MSKSRKSTSRTTSKAKTTNTATKTKAAIQMQPENSKSSEVLPSVPVKQEVETVQEQKAVANTTWEESLGSFAITYQNSLLLFILGLATTLRLFNLGFRSVWYDESFSLILAGRDPATILDGTAHDYHPPLWYFILSGWEKLFGTDLVAARFLSAFFGVLAIWLIFITAKKMFGSRTALLAALIMALSPFEIAYSQEVRMYSFEACLGVLLLYTFYRAYRYNTLLEWAGFIIATTLALYNLYFSVFGVLSLDLFFVVAFWYESRQSKYWSRTKLVRWIGSNLLIALLYLPWLMEMLGQVAKVQKSYWIQKPNPLEFLRLFNVYTLNTTNLTVDGWLATLGLLVASITFVLLLNAMRFKLRRGEKGLRRRSFEVALNLTYCLVPVLIVLIASYLFSPIYLERSLIAFAAPAFILLARVVQTARRPRYWLLLLLPGLILLIASLSFYYNNRLYTNHYELGQASAYVKARYQTGDIVVHTNKLSYLPFIYLKTPGQQFVIPEQPDSPHNDLSLQTEQAIGLQYTPIADAAKTAPNSRIWLVVTAPQPGTDEFWWQKTAKSWLDQNGYKLQEQTPPDEFWGEQIYLYTPPGK